MDQKDIEKLQADLAIRGRHGVDFITSAIMVWILVSIIWTLPYNSYEKSILTFIAGGVTFPLAILFSKVFKTEWKMKDNPLAPLGLWLNIAQLFYFPILVFILLHDPVYFVMTYAIITGAHFFPYAWHYNENTYAVMAGVIVVAAIVLGLILPGEHMYLIAVCMAVLLIVLDALLYYSYKKKLAVA